MSLYTGATKATAFYIGSTPATAVYLGTEKVWPDYTPQEFQFTVYTTNWVIPAAATKVDVVQITGGGGGWGTGVGGSPGDGGQAGNWGGRTLVRGVDFGSATRQDKLQLNVSQLSGKGGAGGSALFPSPSDSVQSQVQVLGMTGNDTTLDIIVPKAGGGGMPTRQGGTPAPFVFNGRTYTPGGVGGNGTGKGGAAGTKYGGGGQGGDSGGLTGNAGGDGAQGCIWVYCY